MTSFEPPDRVTLLHPIPHHGAGEHGTVHDMHHHWIGVRFDSTPNLIRYVEPVDLAPITDHNDVADVTRAAQDAVLHIIEAGWNMHIPCSAKDCDTDAVWWAEHTGCGDTFYVCEPHRAETDDRHQKHIMRTGDPRARCIRCHGITNIPVPWRAL